VGAHDRRAAAAVAPVVAEELNRLLPRYGAALHGRMVGGRGMQLPD
jgi:hypothetical protein